jgi:YggT family protein
MTLAATSTILASARVQIADFISTLIYVYVLLLILYIVIQLLFSVGVRPGYSLWSSRVLGFLHDVCEPYLRIFRRFLPAIGGLDLSPLLGILTLEVVNEVVVRRIIGG